MQANKSTIVRYKYVTYDLQDYENKILHFDNMIFGGGGGGSGNISCGFQGGHWI